MRIRGEAARPERLAAEVVELLLAQPSLQEGPRVDARRRMALEEDLVAGPVIGPAEEVVEADLVQAGGAGVGRKVAADALELELARSTMASAFQRIMRRMRSSIASSPGKWGSCSGEMVLM